MRYLIFALLFTLIPANLVSAQNQWQTMFNGKNLDGWRINENPDSFKVVDGCLVVEGPRGHAFYIGNDEKAAEKLTDFHFKAKVQTMPGANSGIYFHTKFVKTGWPNRGYEAHVNNTQSDKKKTGGLYNVKDNFKAPVKDKEWFDYDIIVKGKHIVVKINWRDNPWFPDVLNQERLRDREELSDAEYRHIWEGEHLDEIENSIIKPEWFNAAIDAFEKLGIKPSGSIVASFDPADSGPDAKAIAVRQGLHFTNVDEISSSDGNEAADEAIRIANDSRAELFAWDGDGMGALLRRQLEDGLVKCEARMYRGSESADFPDSVPDYDDNRLQKSNKDLFYNKRAQYYTELAWRFKNTYNAVEKGQYIDPDDLISIDGSIKLINKLRAEVCRIPRKLNNANGKIQIMPKQEMKRRYNINSPNMADCLAMALEKPLNSKRKKSKAIVFEGW